MIGDLRRQGRTIDEILSHLRTLGVDDVSRSGLGTHIQRIDRIGARMREQRAIAVALADQIGDQPDKLAALNVELVHAAAFKLASAADAEEGADLDVDDVATLSATLRNLAQARKLEGDRLVVAERRAADKARREAADRAGAAAKARGLTPDTAAFIREQILGIA
ncbi:phage protein Gp27 family protein [Tistrella mobilis]|uniref:phage protein Gp27 family protein n=1 Tax=Tistrella mobilis TaxID=171437 RepID=UPI0035575E3E